MSNGKNGKKKNGKALRITHISAVMDASKQQHGVWALDTKGRLWAFTSYVDAVGNVSPGEWLRMPQPSEVTAKEVNG